MDEEEIKKLSEAYAEYMCPVGDYCGGVYDDQRNADLPIYKDDAKSVLEWLSKGYCIVEKKLIIKEWHEIESTGTYAMSQQDAELADKACEMRDMLRRLFGEWLDVESGKDVVDLIFVLGQTSNDNRKVARGLLSKIQNLANREPTEN